MADLAEFEQKIGFSFHHPAYLELALVHSSYINENPGLADESNERLEFLGDAVLGLVIAERLYQDFPRSPEGELTRLRAALVRRETLAQMARKIDLGAYLSLGNGEETGGGREKTANLAGAFESLIAAIYLDQGLESARRFVLNLFGPEIYQQAHRGAGTDYKSKLQEIMQAQRQITPNYVLIEAVGPEHDKQFTVEVWAGVEALGRGAGKSKKLAEMAAAKVALQKCKTDN
jgi:ribonuclease-3